VTGHLDRTRIRALDELAPAVREEALAHLAQCAPCRAVLASYGSERLFSLLVLDRIPEDALDRLSASVATAVGAEGPALPGRRGFAAASLAASLLLAGLVGTYLFSSRVDVAPGAVAISRAESVPVPEVAEAPSGLTRPAGVSTRNEEALVANGFEVVTPEEAEVVRVQIGDTHLVMVFDEALNL